MKVKGDGIGGDERENGDQETGQDALADQFDIKTVGQRGRPVVERVGFPKTAAAEAFTEGKQKQVEDGHHEGEAIDRDDRPEKKRCEKHHGGCAAAGSRDHDRRRHWSAPKTSVSSTRQMRLTALPAATGVSPPEVARSTDNVCPPAEIS
ncbi:hypothetical protein D3C78_987110 [compost metagenome]